LDADLNNLKKRNRLATDCIELGDDKILVGFEELKNVDLSPSPTKEEAYKYIMTRYNIEQDSIEKSIKKDKKLNYLFNKMTKKTNHLNISLPIAMRITAYARMSIYKYKESVGLAGGGGYYTILIQIAFLLPCPYLIT
jgi:hypothetical protein